MHVPLNLPIPFTLFYTINNSLNKLIFCNFRNMENNNNNNNVIVGLRKGAWTKEEDILLRDCIHKFGEGKWHLVPLRAGLNRCRKSCRLRWLNYLRPNLNRGFFSKDEVDLIVRLHKLLGNRWSLIAGRLPGRTANDIKNFWNTHISKKPPSTSTGESSRRGKTITVSNIVRPRPRTFSKSQPPAWSSELARLNSPTKSPANDADVEDPAKSQAPSSSASLHEQTTSDEPHSSSLQKDLDECIRWWGDLLDMTEDGEHAPFMFSDDVPRMSSEAVVPEGFSGGRSSSADQELCGRLSLNEDDLMWNIEQFIDQ